MQHNAKLRARYDLDARWTKKNHETHYGYKDHVKVDVQDKLSLKPVVTAASVHDSQALDAIIDEGNEVLYAVSAYQSAAIDAALDSKIVELRFNEKGTHGNPLTDEQKACHRDKSETPSRVELVFAQMSGSKKALFKDASAWRATQHA